MSRSLGSDGICLYCDAAVALTIVLRDRHCNDRSCDRWQQRPQFLSCDNRLCAYRSNPTFRLQRS